MLLTLSPRVYLAFNPTTQLTAACKVISIASANPAEGDPPRPTRKELEKEVKVHRMLKHGHILEFLDAVLVEENTGFVPGLFVLLELAAGGDLFDKIGVCTSTDRDNRAQADVLGPCFAN